MLRDASFSIPKLHKYYSCYYVAQVCLLLLFPRACVDNNTVEDTQEKIRVLLNNN